MLDDKNVFKGVSLVLDRFLLPFATASHQKSIEQKCQNSIVCGLNLESISTSKAKTLIRNRFKCLMLLVGMESS